MGITEKLDTIEKKLEEFEESKNKKFKLPFGKNLSPKQKKDNYVILVKINQNKQVDFKKVKISEQAFMEDFVPRLGTSDYILMWKKIPIVILPSWSVKPFSPTEDFERSMKDGSNTAGYRILLEKMMTQLVKAKKDIGMLKWIIGGGLALIVGYALLTG